MIGMENEALESIGIGYCNYLFATEVASSMGITSGYVHHHNVSQFRPGSVVYVLDPIFSTVIHCSSCRQPGCWTRQGTRSNYTPNINHTVSKSNDGLESALAR